MFALVRTLPTRDLLVEQVFTLILALAIAEVYYKFGSFLLEAIGFLATWFVIEAGVHVLRRLLRL